MGSLDNMVNEKDNKNVLPWTSRTQGNFILFTSIKGAYCQIIFLLDSNTTNFHEDRGENKVERLYGERWLLSIEISSTLTKKGSMIQEWEN
jgi:hypothetical protein